MAKVTDELVIMGDTDTFAAINAKLEQLIREQRQHREWHRMAHSMALSTIAIVGGLVLGALGWGATEFRGRAEAQAREQARAVATQVAERYSSEHAELRAADQRLANKQIEQGRELQKLAMHRLERQRAAKPR